MSGEVPCTSHRSTDATEGRDSLRRGTFGLLAELRQIVAALSVDSAALEREVRVSSELWAEAAIDKLQAVVGEIEIAGVLARRVARNLHPHADLPGVRCCSDDERLSDREREVLAMLSRGSTVSQIARERALSVKTVSTYRSRMLRKLGFATTAELMRYGIKIRLDD